MSLEMKLALWCSGAAALLALVATVAGASEFMVGMITVPAALLCVVLLGLGFRAEQAREDLRLIERERATRGAAGQR